MRASPGSSHSEVGRAARAGILLVAAGGIAGVLNLLFNVVVARGSGVQQYGAIGPLLTLVTIFGLLATGFQYSVARITALDSRPGHELLGTALRVVLPWALLVLLLAVLAWPMSAFLRIASPVAFVLIAALAAVGILGSAVSGLLVGLRRFRVIAGLVVGSALLRVILGLKFGHGPAAITGSVVASVIPGVVALFVGLGAVAFTGMHRGPEPRPSPAALANGSSPPASSLAAALISSALWCVWGLPMLFARHSLGPTAAGDFAAGQLLAGAIVWGTAPLVTAFFPTIARSGGLAPLVTGGLATLGLALGGLAVLTAIGPLMIHTVYGMAFRPPRVLLLSLAASATVTSAATFACWSAMARGLQWPTLGLLGVAFAVDLVWVSLAGHSATRLAVGPLVSFVICALGLSLGILFHRRRVSSLVHQLDQSAVSLPTSPPAGTDP